jgi:hypothetical protein
MKDVEFSRGSNFRDQGLMAPGKAHKNSGGLDRSEPYHRAAIRARKAHRDKYRPDRKTAESMAKLYRSGLIPRAKRGRRPSTDVTQAIQLRSKGDSWSRIAENLWPRYRQWSYAKQKQKLGSFAMRLPNG